MRVAGISDMLHDILYDNVTGTWRVIAINPDTNKRLEWDFQTEQQALAFLRELHKWVQRDSTGQEMREDGN